MEIVIEDIKKNIVEETINLLKSVGYEEGNCFEFAYTRILHKTNDKGLINTILADKISFVETDVFEPFYMVSHGDNNASSHELTIDNLIAIYYAVENDAILE